MRPGERRNPVSHRRILSFHRSQIISLFISLTFSLTFDRRWILLEQRERERVIRNYNFARWQEFWSRKFDKIIWIETNRIESFVPRYFSSFLAAIYSGSIERISPEDKVRAFDKEVDNRGIKIISQGQADDGWEYRRIPIKRSEDFSSPRFFNLPSLPLLVLIKIK